MDAISSYWERLVAWFNASDTPAQLVTTLLVLIAATFATRAATRYYRGKGSGSTEERRTGYLTARNAIVITTMLLMLFIWGGQLRHFALSVAALAAAAAIASKEYVMSALGSLMRATQSTYSVGDVIEINGLKGEVLTIDLFSTVLLEQAPSGLVTGRICRFPNMLLLLNPVRTISAMGTFVLESVRIPLEPGDDIPAAQARLLKAGREVCEPWLQQADVHFRHIEGAYLIALPASEPLAVIEPVDPKRLDIVLRFPCPSNRRLRSGQEILENYYQQVRDEGERQGDQGQGDQGQGG
ncbi:MAG: mechanosensitive ion channel family protein [Pigmentiphaga sp.]|uniref:mechanosensitive ion channel family protein n=1 Tax=Pigmentiphaga sp. TaxID=1977564 RepID=UPI0029A816A1|nr:mechanosensitive ion channel family protein [Pigmentiphaga sp.]MDX3905763.1 mechanosensitive ion channel family protein [Pigmentiphaga sp.]